MLFVYTRFRSPCFFSNSQTVEASRGPAVSYHTVLNASVISLIPVSVTTQCWMLQWCHTCLRLILVPFEATICNRIPIMGLVSLSHYRPWSEQSNQCGGRERTGNPVLSSSEGCHLLADVFYANYISKENLLRSFVTASALVCVGRECFAWLR